MFVIRPFVSACVLVVFVSLTACKSPQQETPQEVAAAPASAVKEKAEKPKKKGKLVSVSIRPLGDIDPENEPDKIVQVTAKVINMSPEGKWAIVEDQGRHYYAFGHAGMPLIPKNALNQQIYIRGAIEDRPLGKELFEQFRIHGVAPDAVPDLGDIRFRLNTLQSAMVSEMSAEAFMNTQNF